MTPLQQGDKVPGFECKTTGGDTVSDSSLLGHKYVLYFYPKDSTPTCTVQACNLRDHHEALSMAGYKVFGISPDGAKSHQKFIDKHKLPFDLLLDEDRTMIEAFGVWGEKKMFGRAYMGVFRTTIVVDETGHISRVISKVKAKEHHLQILAE